MQRRAPTTSLIAIPLLALAAAWGCGGGRSQLPGPGTLATATGGAGGVSTTGSTSTTSTQAPCLPTTYPVNTRPTGIVLADLDGDGRLDVVVTNQEDQTVSVLRGNGDGTLAPQEVLGIGARPRGIVAADLDGDGRLDLAVATSGNGSVGTRLNAGGGIFGSPAFTQVGGPTASEPTGLAAADVDHDGRVDLVLTFPEEGTITVLQGKGDGAFTVGDSFPLGELSDSPDAIVAVDLDGDGWVDIVAATGGSEIVVLRNHGGVFATVEHVNAGAAEAYAVLAADLDGSGRPSIAVTDRAGGAVIVLAALPGGTFASPVRFPAGPASSGLVAADLNGDGRTDLAVALANPGGVFAVLLNAGGGSFGPPLSHPLPGQPSPWTVTAGDLDGNGRPELVLVNTQASSITVVPDACLP
jgi:hypothetical protein